MKENSMYQLRKDLQELPDRMSKGHVDNLDKKWQAKVNKMLELGLLERTSNRSDAAYIKVDDLKGLTDVELEEIANTVEGPDDDGVRIEVQSRIYVSPLTVKRAIVEYLVKNKHIEESADIQAVDFIFEDGGLKYAHVYQQEVK